jgi:hypothetical protein
VVDGPSIFLKRWQAKASGGNTKQNKAVDVVDDASEQRLRPLREVCAGR